MYVFIIMYMYIYIYVSIYIKHAHAQPYMLRFTRAYTHVQVNTHTYQTKCVALCCNALQCVTLLCGSSQ